MSDTYTFSQAQVGRGALLSIGPVAGTSSPTYVPVYELNSIPFQGPAWEKVSVTNFQSGKFGEWIQTIQNWPELDLGGNYVALDPGQLAIQAAQAAGGLFMFTLEYPLAPGQTSTGKTISFNAFVMSYGTDLSPTKDMTLQCKLQPSGAFTVVAGS